MDMCWWWEAADLAYVLNKKTQKSTLFTLEPIVTCVQIEKEVWKLTTRTPWHDWPKRYSALAGTAAVSADDGDHGRRRNSTTSAAMR
jgi:hypothetical protein